MKRWELALRLVGVGFFIGGFIVLGTVSGLWLDGRLNTKPVFTIGGLLLGLVVAGYGVYQMILPLIRNDRDGDDR